MMKWRAGIILAVIGAVLIEAVVFWWIGLRVIQAILCAFWRWADWWILRS